MPIYEYQCPQCAHVFEEWVHVREAADEAPCPQCGQPAVHIISNTAFVLKGGGWYVTEYGSRKHATDDSPATPDAAATPASAPDSSPDASPAAAAAPQKDTAAATPPASPAPAPPATSAPSPAQA